jgi:hypothetical protein
LGKIIVRIPNPESEKIKAAKALVRLANKRAKLSDGTGIMRVPEF